MLAAKKNTRTVTTEVAQEKKTGLSLWILLDNNRSKIWIGVIYVPQQNELKHQTMSSKECIAISANRF